MIPRRHLLIGAVICFAIAALGISVLIARAEPNTYLGQEAGYHSSGEHSNTAIGAYVLRENGTSGENTGIGVKALRYNYLGSRNTAAGLSALETNQGSYNTAVGASALMSNAGAWDNTAVGSQAMVANTTGGENTAIGGSSMAFLLSGSRNDAFGGTSLYYLVNGGNNVGMGSWTGANPLNDIPRHRVISDTYMTLIGHGATKDSESALTNSTAIGSAAHATKSNQVVLGNDAVTETVLKGSVRVSLANGYACIVSGALVSQVAPCGP